MRLLVVMPRFYPTTLRTFKPPGPDLPHFFLIHPTCTPSAAQAAARAAGETTPDTVFNFHDMFTACPAPVLTPPP